MGWKNWSYWLKGGIIGLIITVLAEIIFIVFLISIKNTDPFAYALMFIILFWGAVLTLILVIIGLIIGKIRSKREK